MKAGTALAEARPAAAKRNGGVAQAAVVEARESANGTEVGHAEPEGVDEAANGTAALPAGGPEETNVWPTAEEEAVFLSEARGRGDVVVPVSREAIEDAEDDPKGLPKLNELVERIPAETRELLDELFRARFVAVRRVKKADLKK